MRDDTIHKAQSNIKDGDILLTYWGVHHNWDKHNDFIFEAYLRNLKGVLM